MHKLVLPAHATPTAMWPALSRSLSLTRECPLSVSRSRSRICSDGKKEGARGSTRVRLVLVTFCKLRERGRGALGPSFPRRHRAHDGLVDTAEREMVRSEPTGVTQQMLTDEDGSCALW